MTATPAPQRESALDDILDSPDHFTVTCDAELSSGKKPCDCGRAEIIAAARAELAAMRADLSTALETNKSLNRRCQSAEAGLAAKLTSGPSFGRALANSAAVMWKAKCDEAVAQLATARAEALEQAAMAAADYVNKIAGFHSACAIAAEIRALRAGAGREKE